MSTLVFGHKSPDTDATGSPIIWSWYLNEVQGHTAEPALQGEPNTEANWMLDRWELEKPQIIANVEAGQDVVIVDTNNPAELPTASTTRTSCRSSTTTGWSAGFRRKARSRSTSVRWPAPRRSCST